MSIYLGVWIMRHQIQGLFKTLIRSSLKFESIIFAIAKGEQTLATTSATQTYTGVA